MNKLEIENLSKIYGKKVANDKITVTLENGVYGLLGPNGAGNIATHEEVKALREETAALTFAMIEKELIQMWYKIIKKYYDDKLWSKEQVKTAVIKNKITENEYKNIIGEDYIVQSFFNFIQ